MSIEEELKKVLKLSWRYDTLDEAVAKARECTLAAGGSGDESVLAACQACLGYTLEARFERLGHISDIEEAIAVNKEAVKLTPDDSSDKGARLGSLSNVLELHFERLGLVEDIDEAIDAARRSLHLKHGSDADKAIRANNLANTLLSRFERLHQLQDVEEAISAVRQALELSPEDNADKALWLSTLGSALLSRFERLNQPKDLEEAIVSKRRATELMSDGIRAKAGVLNNLSNALYTRFGLTGEQNDIEEAISASRRAVDLLEDDRPEKAAWLSNLGGSLHSRSMRLDRDEDLEEAISVKRRAVDLTPDDSSDKVSWLYNLGLSLKTRYDRQGDMKDAEESISVLGQACALPLANPFHQVSAGTVLLSILESHKRFDHALETAKTILTRLPKLSTRALNRTDQMHVVSQFTGVGSDACALALHRADLATDDQQRTAAIREALSLLEQGRGAVIGVALDDRADIDDVQAVDAALARRFVVSRTALNEADNESSEQRRRRLQDFDSCLEEIRALPGLAGFLLPPSIVQIQEAARDDYIVCVNVSDLRSDAIIITRSRIKYIKLSKLDYYKVSDFGVLKSRFSGYSNVLEEGKNNKTLKRFLTFLWESCVRLILEDVASTEAAKTTGLPRVVWVGNGAASGLPFHAAGNYAAPSAEIQTTMHRAISSYVPSIKVLWRMRSQTITRRATSHSVLVTTMPETPGEARLEGVTEEAESVLSSIGSQVARMHLQQPDAKTVLTALQNKTIFHYAGHAVAEPADAAYNHLLYQRVNPTIQQQEKDPLYLWQLFELNDKQAQLAFLSACSTADNRDERLGDEGLHLAGAFLMAGFRNVVACQWPSDDTLCVSVVKYFYESLDVQGQTLSDGDVARALHQAVQHAIHNAEAGSIVDRPLLWAPYAHYGP